MGKAFTDEEKLIIYKKLIRVGLDEISTYGFKKTSIDEIARKVGISKGAFYKFFPSKEMFFFSILESVEKEIKKEAKKIIPKESNNLREDLIINFCNYVSNNEMNKFVSLLQCDDLDNIFRSLPEDEVKRHFHKDENDVLDILNPLEHLINISKIDLEFISSMLRVLFLTIQHKQQIGDSSIDKIIRAQVEIIVDNILIAKK